MSSSEIQPGPYPCSSESRQRRLPDEGRILIFRKSPQLFFHPLGSGSESFFLFRKNGPCLVLHSSKPVPVPLGAEGPK